MPSATATRPSTAIDPYAIACAAIPGHTERAAALERLAAHRSTRLKARLVDPRRAQAELAEEVAAACRAGDPIPDDVGPRAYACANVTVVAGSEDGVLELAETALRYELENCVRAGADHGLRSLHDQLGYLLDEVRRLVKTTGPRPTAENTLGRPEAAAAYLRLRELVSVYGAIRSAQARLTTRALPSARRGPHDIGPTSALDIAAVAGDVQNIDEVWPTWHQARRRERHDPPPWPTEELAPIKPRVGVELLCALAARPDIRTWVPTTGELVDAYDAAHAAVAARRLEAARTKGQTRQHAKEWEEAQ